MSSSSKSTRIFIVFLFIFTAGLAVAAILISGRLREGGDVTPDESQADDTEASPSPIPACETMGFEVYNNDMCIRKRGGGTFTGVHYRCPDEDRNCDQCIENGETFRNVTSVCFDDDCGTEQIDIFVSGGDCFFSSCNNPPCYPEEEPTSTPTPTPTPTVTDSTTPTPSESQTPTPTSTPTATVNPTCGDAVCHTGESCDKTAKCIGSGEWTPGECRLDCTYCGDGVIQDEYGEECDDNNTNPNDSCNNACEVVLPPGRCGDGICNTGEACDSALRCTGGGVFTPGECRGDCTYCGDGVVQAGEQCDDGDTIDNDECTNGCMTGVVTPSPTLPRNYCGDGILGPGEQCEPGIVGSCGPGGVCRIDCTCMGGQPGLCGSSCQSDYQCPSGNICANGFCRLYECSGGMLHTITGGISGIIPNIGLGPGMICSSNGCEITQCGEPCLTGGICPSLQSCNSSNICVLTWCLRNPGSCSDPCILPGTSLGLTEVNIIIFAILVLLSGVIIYRTDTGLYLWQKVQDVGIRNLFARFSRSEEKIGIRKDKKSKGRSFEKRILKDKEE